MKKKNQKDEMIPGVGQNDKTSTEKPGTDINANNNSKDPATATDVRITAQADNPRNADAAAGNVGNVVNGGGTPIAEMDKEGQRVALETLARSLKEGAIDKATFIAGARGVAYKRVKAALKKASVPADIRDEILEEL